jgi:hypothetical protein
VAVLELAEAELGIRLGPVAGDDLGDRPPVAAGDQYPLAEDLFFQLVTGALVDVEGQP